MSVGLRVRAEALQQIENANAWWRVNRPAARELFASELAAAFEVLQARPGLGRIVPHPRVPGLRVLNLQRTRYHLYYVHDIAADCVQVLAVWSAMRGRRPPLKGGSR